MVIHTGGRHGELPGCVGQFARLWWWWWPAAHQVFFTSSIISLSGSSCQQRWKRMSRSVTSGVVLASLTGHQAGCGISGLATSTIGLWSASFDCSVTCRHHSHTLHPVSSILVWQVRLWVKGEGEGEFTCQAVLSGHKHPIRCIAVDSARWFFIVIVKHTKIVSKPFNTYHIL